MYKVKLNWLEYVFARCDIKDAIDAVKKFEETLNISLINMYDDDLESDKDGYRCYFIADEETILYFTLKYGDTIVYKVEPYEV